MMQRDRQSSRRNRHAAARAGFTLAELMVAVALLAAVLLMVSQIFTISSEAAGRVNAQAEVFTASAALREQMTSDLGRIISGFLAIECPPPTDVRVETPGGTRVLRLRHDRLVFLAGGSSGQYQSFTDPTRAYPTYEDLSPASSASALIYYGPGVTRTDNAGNPLSEAAFLSDQSIPASDWALSRRAILLLNQRPAMPVPAPTNSAAIADWLGLMPDMTSGAFGSPFDDMLDGSAGLLDVYRLGMMDAVSSDVALGRTADPQTIVDIINAIGSPNPLLSATSSPIRGLWEMNWCPPTISQRDPSAADYFTRSGFTFDRGLVDFRIEWTDGRRVNPPTDQRTRWFGLYPDPNTTPNNLGYLPYARRLLANSAENPALESAVFGGIELAPFGANARYRAVWRAGNWQYRPKALRFTYRIYDRALRLSETVKTDLNENGQTDDTEGGPDLLRRYGQEFSIVLPLP